MAKSSVPVATIVLSVLAGGAAQASNEPLQFPVYFNLQDRAVEARSVESLNCLNDAFQRAQQDASVLREILAACEVEFVDLNAVELTKISNGSQF